MLLLLQCALAVLLLAVPLRSGAVDGVIEINQARALAGGVTPGDSPGFPVDITLPGSYRLTSDLDKSGVDPNQPVIDITVSQVSLDLNGFSLIDRQLCSNTPPTGCTISGTGQGVSAASFGASGVSVSNGIVRGAIGVGIALAARSRVERVRVEGCGSHGIAVGNESVVSDSIAYRNFGSGIGAGARAVVRGNTSTSNAQAGIQVGRASSVIGNASSLNGTIGIASTSAAASILDNVVVENVGLGLSLTAADAYGRNEAYGNSGNLAGTAGQVGGGGFQVSPNACNGLPCP